MVARAGGGLDDRPRKFYRELVEQLIRFAEHEFWLSQPLEGGATRREHFASAARQGMPSPYEAGPSFPEPLRHLWVWFLDLHAGRTQSGLGASKATHFDLLAWQWNTGTRLLKWELDAMQALGSAWLAETNIKKPDGDLPPALRNR